MPRPSPLTGKILFEVNMSEKFKTAYEKMVDAPLLVTDHKEKTNVLIHGVKMSTLEKLTRMAAVEELSRNRFINGILDEFVSEAK
jgi:hypothetical protein